MTFLVLSLLKFMPKMVKIMNFILPSAVVKDWRQTRASRTSRREREIMAADGGTDDGDDSDENKWL